MPYSMAACRESSPSQRVVCVIVLMTDSYQCQSVKLMPLNIHQIMLLLPGGISLTVEQHDPGKKKIHRWRCCKFNVNAFASNTPQYKSIGSLIL